MGVAAEVLGSIEASLDGRVVSLGGARQRRLLGYLSLTPGRSRGHDGIVLALWPEGEMPHDAKPAVHTAVSRLRNALGDPAKVVARSGGYSLEGVEVDAEIFLILVDTARKDPDPSSRADTLRRALALWRGPAFDEFAHEPWARADATRLDEQRAHASDELGEALLAADRSSESVADLEAAAERSPLRERTHRILMTALHRSGRQGEALRVYQAFRDRLATELGLEPSDEIKAADAEIASSQMLSGGSSGGSPGNVQPVRSYELGDEIGRGSFAVVYRGKQRSVQREVAVKVIRSELADRPEFIRRFEAEANVVARLEHPYIVPLYDFWREPGSAYLVMRWMRGGTLEHRLASGALAINDAVRVLSQVGSGLAAAHRAGVVHRDVRPANILLDDEGNAYLSDFGIATSDSESGAASSAMGSPAYSSPEQLGGGPVDMRSDVFAFAITAFETLTGRLPFTEVASRDELLRRQLDSHVPSASAIRSELPAVVDAVINRATAKTASQRHGSVDDFVRELIEALTSTPPPPDPATLRNPYKGLRAFHEADAADYFGRERLVARLVEGLREKVDDSHRLTALVGPSGSGKSSVVRAGLLPALRNGAVNGSADWYVTTMVPGAHPFEELEAALARVAVNRSPLDASSLRAPRGVARAVKRALGHDEATLLIVIDQFEELYSLVEDPERSDFIERIIEAVDDPGTHLRLVITLRADQFDRPLAHPRLATLFGRHTITVGAMTTDELERAVSEPAILAGGSFEAGLVTRIVSELVGQASALPLLQYTLTELFEERNGSGAMTIAAYESTGGLGGAVASRAEALLSEAPADGTARRLFTRLVTIGSGHEVTRRRLKLTDVGSEPETTALVDRFGRARLLSFDRDPTSREATIELAHDALIGQWPRLRSWIEEDRDGLRLHQQLGAASRSWDDNCRDDGELYRGGRLELAETWAEQANVDLTAVEREFLAVSTASARAESAARHRSATRLRGALVAVTGLAIASMIAGGLAWSSRQRATQSADRAETARLAASSPALAKTDFTLGLLAAAESYRREPTPQTLGALQQVMVAQDRILGFLGNGNSYWAVAVDGPTVFGLRVGSIDRWDLSTLVAQPSITIPSRAFLDPDNPASPYLGRLSVRAGVATVRFADSSGVVVNLASGTARSLPPALRSVVSPDGSEIAVVRPDHAVELLKAADLTRIWQTDVPKEHVFGDQLVSIAGPPAASDPTTPLLVDLAFLDNGDIVSARTWRLQRLDGSTGAIEAEFAQRFASPPLGQRTTTGGIGAATWIATTKDAVVGIGIAAGATWRADDLSLVAEAFTWRGNPLSTSFSNGFAVLNSGAVAVVRADGSMVEIDLATGEERSSAVDTQIGVGRALAVDAESTRAVVAGTEGIAVLALNGDRPLARAVRTADARNISGVVTGDAIEVVVDGVPQLGDDAPELVAARCSLASIQPCVPLPANESSRSDAVGFSQGRSVIWDRVGNRAVFGATSTLREVVIGEVGFALGAVAAPRSGTWLAIVSQPKFRRTVLRVADVRSGAPLAAIELPEAGWQATYSNDGSELLLFNRISGDSRRVDTKTWKLDVEPPFAQATIVGAAFNRHGDRLFAVMADGSSALIDWPERRVLRSFSGDNSLSNSWTDGGIEFFENDRYVASSLDTVGRLWDLETGVAIGAPFSSDPSAVSSVAAGPTPVLLTYQDGHALVWDLDVEHWFDRACAMAGRNMTRLEWATNGPRNATYRATCPQWPAAQESR